MLWQVPVLASELCRQSEEALAEIANLIVTIMAPQEAAVGGLGWTLPSDFAARVVQALTGGDCALGGRRNQCGTGS